MNDILLRQINHIARARRWQDYKLDFVTKYITTNNYFVRLDPKALFFLYEYGEVYDTARVIVASSTNIHMFTKDFKPKTLTYFSDYLEVRYENGEFVPFYLTFLKVTPCLTKKS